MLFGMGFHLHDHLTLLQSINYYLFIYLLFSELEKLVMDGKSTINQQVKRQQEILQSNIIDLQKNIGILFFHFLLFMIIFSYS